MFRLGVRTLPTVSLACGQASWSLSHHFQLPPPPTWREKWLLQDPCSGWVSLSSGAPQPGTADMRPARSLGTQYRADALSYPHVRPHGKHRPCKPAAHVQELTPHLHNHRLGTKMDRDRGVRLSSASRLLKSGHPETGPQCPTLRNKRDLSSDPSPSPAPHPRPPPRQLQGYMMLSRVGFSFPSAGCC